MTRHIGRWAVLAIVLAGIAFSAYNNAALFLSILGTDLTGWIFSIVGLVLFDLGAVGWALFFTHGATGSAQRATALIAALACLVLTLSGAALHLLLTQSLMAVPTWAGMAAAERAKRIRALGELAPQSASAFANLTSIKDGDPEKDASEMLKELIKDHGVVISTARAALDAADEVGDEASVDLMTQRLAAHEKAAWMLRSSLGDR